MGEKLEFTKTVIELGIAICTVIASVLAWRNSKKTKEDVSTIKAIKNEILDKQNIEEIGLVKEEILKIRRVSTKYRNVRNTYTVNKDIEQIQTSLIIIKENRRIFKDNNESDYIYNEIKSFEHKLLDIQDCNNVGKTIEHELVTNSARNLVIKLDDFLAKLKELKDSKKYDLN
ncbi:MAG: hypothetical protein E6371_06040 [Terrisporobacter othiniensis]|uniref:hypothetical protein n=1 Tax=Terrisporobacter othiniensis TaxID=1577792 RepID=UPI002911394D|nr:hypothetical protein [Terrisporobacter othiniensis]MDU6983958.1 hypothetical protein [Terrisporobacter othiniensis]